MCLNSVIPSKTNPQPWHTTVDRTETVDSGSTSGSTLLSMTLQLIYVCYLRTSKVTDARLHVISQSLMHVMISGTISGDRGQLILIEIYPYSKSTVMLQDKIEQSIVRKGFSRLSLAFWHRHWYRQWQCLD